MVVDPSVGESVAVFLKKRNLTPHYILNTHHHMDHIGGNALLRQLFPKVEVIAPAMDLHRIPTATRGVADGEQLVLGDGALRAQVIYTPGHTSGHVAYYFDGALFCGDTLFSLGCGRVFEGTHAQMWESLKKLTKLPPDTLIYCGHEYSLANAEFALSLMPRHWGLVEKKAWLVKRLKQNLPTLPTTLATELELNLFLRPHCPKLRAALKLDPALPDAEVFSKLRQLKDT